jgi:hypothetical protein
MAMTEEEVRAAKGFGVPEESAPARRKEPGLQRALTILVFGAPKVGKSSLAVSGPEPRCVFDVEGSARFLPVNAIEWNPASEEPPELDGTWDTAVIPTIDWSVAEAGKRWLQSGRHPFKSVAIDSVSELQQRRIEHVAGREQMTQQNWGDVFRTVSGFIRDMRDLTMHPTRPIESVTMTAMARQIDGMWKPWCQGQLQSVLPYLLDVTAYIWVEQTGTREAPEETRKILTRRTSQFEAGERVQGRIPAVVELVKRPPDTPSDDVVRLLDMVFPSTAAGPLTAVPSVPLPVEETIASESEE